MSGTPKLILSLDHPDLGSVSAEQMRRYVTAIKTVESCDALDAATLVLSIPDLSSTSRDTLPLRAPGSVLSIGISDGTRTLRTLTLDVVSARHTARGDAPSSITLIALEPLQRLRGLHLSQVAEEGGEALQLFSEAVKAATGGGASRASSTDAAALGLSFFDRPLLAALKRAAHQRGLRCALTLGTTGSPSLGFEKIDDGDALTLTWGKDLRAMDLSMDLSRQVTAVEVYGLPDPSDETLAERDPTPGKAPKASGSAGKLTGAGLLGGWKLHRTHAVQSWLPSAGGDGPASEIANPRKAADLDREAARLYAEISRRFVSGRVVGRAQPAARKNGHLSFKGAPWPYDARFSIVEVQHAWSPDDAFSTEIGFEAAALERP